MIRVNDKQLIKNIIEETKGYSGFDEINEDLKRTIDLTDIEEKKKNLLNI
jgi:hypothetical protein